MPKLEDVSSQNKPGWQLIGSQLKRGRFSLTALVFGFLVAFQTFGDIQNSNYSIPFAVIVLAGCLWAGVQALRRRIIFGLAFFPFGVFWLMPLLGFEFFREVPVLGFLIHAIVALLFGVAGYSYLAIERKN